MISCIEVLFRLTLLKLGIKTKTETTATLQKTLTSQGAWGHLESYPPNSPCSEVRDITIPALQVGKNAAQTPPANFTHSTAQHREWALQLTQWWVWIWVQVLGSYMLVFSLKHGSPLSFSERQAVLWWCQPCLFTNLHHTLPVCSPTEPWA